MYDDPRLLVVDDEDAICEGCRRVLSRHGFQVEKTNDAAEGLSLATERDYSAVLLDIKMPKLDGIGFLEQLRAKKPTLPVILMTGYPSVPNTISALRLGASEYITKPFTPEEICRAVQKCVPTAKREPQPADAWTPAGDGACFLGQAWAQQGKDGSVRVGTALPRAQVAAVKEVRLPGIGEVVYQGLPLAAVTLADGQQQILPAAVSGVVLAVNDTLRSNPAALAADPCGQGWVASLLPTRFEDEEKKCSRRRVILLNVDATAAQTQADKLAALGYQVRTVTRREDLAPLLSNPDYPVLIMDTAGFDDVGPALVGQIHAAAPSMRIVLLAASGRELESAYRSQRIFYYAVEPFGDNEIVDILAAAFRTPPAVAPWADKRHTPPGPLCSIRITNRNAKKVLLAVAPGLLHRETGVGAAIRYKLLDRRFPTETVSGAADLDPYHILKMAASCDRLVVLLAKDMERLPGTLVRDSKAEFISISGDDASKVTFQVVQPGPSGGLDELSSDAIDALAEHLIADMEAY